MHPVHDKKMKQDTWLQELAAPASSPSGLLGPLLQLLQAATKAPGRDPTLQHFLNQLSPHGLQSFRAVFCPFGDSWFRKCCRVGSRPGALVVACNS